MDANTVGADPVQVVILVMLWGLILAWVALSHQPRLHQGVPVPVKKRTPLKPKTGDDCALWGSSLTLKREAAGRCLPPPWRTVRSRRGTQETLEHGSL